MTKKRYNIIKYGWFATFITILCGTQYLVGYLTGSDLKTALVIIVEGLLLIIPDCYIAKWLNAAKKRK